MGTAPSTPRTQVGGECNPLFRVDGITEGRNMTEQVGFPSGMP
jgi:hypothetical protein